jgi:eukaryotic-like serine/threonine-protein kinase
MTSIVHPTSSDSQNAALAADLSSRYQLGPLVAQGGMGRVFEARALSDGRRVAVKVLHARLARDQRCRTLMMREALAIQTARHPRVVPLVEHGETRSGLPYLVLEWLEGRTLHDLLAEEAPLEPARIERLFTSLLETLADIHARGVVHADLKPENLMLVIGANGREQLHLLDFGVSSVGDQHFASAGEVCGTPGYLAPEILCGAPPSPSSDLYAAGIMLYELITGHMPFRGATPAALLLEQLHQPLPLPSTYWAGARGAWDQLLLKMLAPEPGDRFTDARQALHAFQRALAKQAPSGSGRTRSSENGFEDEAPTTRFLGPARKQTDTDAETDVRGLEAAWMRSLAA